MMGFQLGVLHAHLPVQSVPDEVLDSVRRNEVALKV